jgi:polyhydroxyalkanoate synthesis regulator protein
MKMFSPFSFTPAEPDAAAAPSAPQPAAEPAKDDLGDLRKQMAAMQEQLAALSKK